MGKWDGMVTRRDTGMETCLFSPLLVVGSGLVILSVLMGLVPLRSLVVCFIV